MKKLLGSILLTALTLNIALAQDLEKQWQNRGQGKGQGMQNGKSAEFQNLTPEEKHAKMQEIYNNASPEQKARMDAKRLSNQTKAKELGFDLNTAEGRQNFQTYRKQNRGQGMGMGKGQGQGGGKGKGRHGQN